MSASHAPWLLASQKSELDATDPSPRSSIGTHLTFRSAARSFRPPFLRLARCALLGGLQLTAACNPETRSPPSWSMTFACAAHAAQSKSVEVAIASGTCAAPGAALYRATILRGDAKATAAPPSLEVGTYAFSATAYDGRGGAITMICRDVVLPAERGVTLVLPGPHGCAPPRSPDQVDGEDGPDAPPLDDAGAFNDDGSVPAADASPPAETDEDAGVDPCSSDCQTTTIYSSPTQDISLPKECWAPGEFMPVTIHMPVTAKDWLWVKNHPDYGGKDQEFWDYSGITTASSVYRGGEREPAGLHAPSTTGAFNITWHQNDGGDKDVRSNLVFTVSNDCP